LFLLRYSVFTISNEAISWKTPMVGMPASAHLEARNNLLDAAWWRASQFKERNYFNDTAVLWLYENNEMILGSKKI